MNEGLLQERVIVAYSSTDRDVYVDGKRCGLTNQLLTVETGSHTFDLGEPPTYAPPKITKLIYGTTAEQPLVITFTPEL